MSLTLALNRLVSSLRYRVRRLRRRPSRETVLFTEEHLVLVWPERGEEAVAWDAITHISLRATEGVAGVESLYIYVMAGRERLVIPRSAGNAEELLRFIRALPACDIERFDQLLAHRPTGGLEGGLVTVWQRPQGNLAQGETAAEA